MEEPSTLQGRKKCPKVSSKNPKRSCWFLATCWIIPLASLSLLGQTFSEILLFLFLCVSFYFFLFFSLSLSLFCLISNAGGRPLREKISKIDDIKRRRPRHSAPFFTNQCASPSVQFASFRLFFFHYFTVVSLISLPPYWASIVWIRFEALPVSSIRFNLISLLQCSTSSHSLSTGLEVPCLVIISQSES